MNEMVQDRTGKFDPLPVLKRLAQITADCLPTEPDERLMAEQLLPALQKMGVSKWKSGNYIHMPPPESAEEKKTRNQFWWIDSRNND
jgi:hypothetical protein